MLVYGLQYHSYTLFIYAHTHLGLSSHHAPAPVSGKYADVRN